ncbi:MAG: hypothetical protein AB7V77_00835 [Candidatus Woesearchaeota archaeon]
MVDIYSDNIRFLANYFKRAENFRLEFEEIIARARFFNRTISDRDLCDTQYIIQKHVAPKTDDFIKNYIENKFISEAVLKPNMTSIDEIKENEEKVARIDEFAKQYAKHFLNSTKDKSQLDFEKALHTFDFIEYFNSELKKDYYFYNMNALLNSNLDLSVNDPKIFSPFDFEQSTKKSNTIYCICKEMGVKELRALVDKFDLNPELSK